MQTEIEATFLEVDHDSTRATLRKLGAQLKQPLSPMKRTTFDYKDMRLNKKAAWIRVRQEGDKTTMTFKQRQSETIKGMKEIECTVDNYNKTCDFLLAIGLIVKARQETKRETWQLDGCEIMLDTWPWIPSYVEVEGPDEPHVKAVSGRLGFDWATAMFDSADAVYQRYFDVTRTEISSFVIAFGPVPDWLEKRRRS